MKAHPHSFIYSTHQAMPSPQGGSKKYCSEYTGMFRAQGYPKTGVLRNASVVHTTLLARIIAKSSCINILGFPVFIWKLKFRRQPQNLLKQLTRIWKFDVGAAVSLAPLCHTPDQAHDSQHRALSFIPWSWRAQWITLLIITTLAVKILYLGYLSQ